VQIVGPSVAAALLAQSAIDRLSGWTARNAGSWAHLPSIRDPEPPISAAHNVPAPPDRGRPERRV